MRHDSSLACIVGTIYVHIDAIFPFYGHIPFFSFFFNTHLYCLVGCLSMVAWTHAVLGVLYGCVLYFGVCTCSV